MFFLNITEKTANVQDKQENMYFVHYVFLCIFYVITGIFFTIKYVMFICFISSSVLCLDDANNSERKESLAM